MRQREVQYIYRLEIDDLSALPGFAGLIRFSKVDCDESLRGEASQETGLSLIGKRGG